MIISDLECGATFVLNNGDEFYKARGAGNTRKVRRIEDNQNGSHTVCTTLCGETYTLDSNTPISIIS